MNFFYFPFRPLFFPSFLLLLRHDALPRRCVIALFFAEDPAVRQADAVSEGRWPCCRRRCHFEAAVVAADEISAAPSA